MNAPFTPKPGIDAFHRERSRCIDAFSRLEAAIVALLDLANHTCGTESFGQKLALLRKARPTPKLSKARLSAVQKLLNQCEKHAEVRNDIVHSTLQLGIIGETHRACFINMRYCQSGSQTARLFTLEGLRTLTAEMDKIAESLLDIQT